MRKLLLCLLFLSILIFPSWVHADPSTYLNIPPTNAFDKIHTDNGTVSAVNFSMPLTIKGGSNISVTSSNASHTLTISGSTPSNTNQGTYNKTLANNGVINSNGNRLNFINGTNNPVSLVNDPSRNQINITISSSGGSSGVTSLNALSGALTISCVVGNTTCTTSGGNTITVNTAYNVVVTGGSAQTISKGITHTADITMSGANINLGSNMIKTSGYIIQQTQLNGAQALSIAHPIANNTAAYALIYPSGINKQAIYFVSRGSDITTNYEVLELASDSVTTGEYALRTISAGTGTLYPINVYQGSTKLLSFDTANTATFYVPTKNGTNNLVRNPVFGNNGLNMGSTSAKTYYALGGQRVLGSGAEVQSQAISPISGHIKNLYVHVATNTNSNSTILTVRDNSINTNISITIGAGATGTFSDTSHNLLVSPGDLLSISTSTCSVAALGSVAYSYEFDPT